MCNENRIGVVSKLDQAPILSWKYWSKAFWNPKKLVYQRQHNDIIWKRLMDLKNKELNKQTWQWIRIK